jgi:hypothetical protein
MEREKKNKYKENGEETEYKEKYVVVGVYILNVNLTNSILYYRGREKKNQGSG